MNTAHILSALDEEISKLERVRQILVGDSYSAPTPQKRGPGRPKKIAPPSRPRKRVMSEEARAKIAAAQKKRWAAAKKAAK